MPTDIADAETGGTDLIFADDVSGTVFQLREGLVYEADEVREKEGGDIPKFGKWLPVTANGTDSYMVAVSELVEELQVVENPMGLTFKVTRCEKSGSNDTDPYHVNVEVQDGDPNQSGLDL